MKGVNDIKPEIKKIDFKTKGKITLYLKDGRVLLVPLEYFPAIKKLNSVQRKKYKVLDDCMIMFKEAGEVYHIEDFLGKYADYKYRFAA